MKHKKRYSHTALLTGLLTLCALSMGWGQIEVQEDFVNMGFVNGQVLPSGNLDLFILFTTQQNDAGTATAYFDSGSAIRMYRDVGGFGGGITIQANAGATITDIEFYAQNASYTPNVSYSVDGGGSLSESWDGTTYTVSGISAINDVVFWNANTDVNTQWRITGVKVTYTAPVTAVLSANPLSVSNLNYQENNGPSDSQVIQVSGLGLDGTQDVTILLDGGVASNFEISEDDNAFAHTITLTNYEGDDTDIFVRLKSGLPIDDYIDGITISGYGADAVEVLLEGKVTEELVVYANIEDFTNSEATESYDDGSFTGNYSIIWNYIHSRNEGIYPINGNGLMLRRANEPSSLSATIPEGVADFAVSTRKAFTGNIQRRLELVINGVVIAQFEPDFEDGDDDTIHQFVVNDINVPGNVLLELRLYGADGNQQITLDDITWSNFPADYTWEDGAWSPQTPIGNATDTDDILIVNGTAVFSGDIEMNNLYVQNGATLQVENTLKVNGNISNHGSIVFVSTSVANTAQFDTFTGTITGNGTVTAERFIPARRAFRFLSSPITTTGSINANWQEGVNNPDASTNLNPNPGYGTHITGSNTGANGFDATPSGNPSLFGFDNSTQAWTTVANTDINTIVAGTPYRLFVRGDRSVEVTSNDAIASDTRLRVSGELFTGTYANANMGTTAADYNFVGNPYQAAIDMSAALSVSTNLNPASYYIWDPTLNDRGAYVAVDLIEGGSSNLDSGADEFLQPGQAAFVTTLADGAAVFQVEEAHKAVTQSGVTVFNVLSKVDMRLYTHEAYNNNEKAADGVRVKFKTDGNNEVDSFDIPKLGNLDENLAIVNNGNYLSIESRNMPTNEDVIPLFINQYRHTNYIFVAEVQEMNNVEVWLRDYFLQSETLLPNNQVSEISFTLDADDTGSSATDRFELFFVEVEMGVDEQFAGGFVVFPNPSEGNFYMQTNQLNGEIVVVNLTNMLGQQLLNMEIEIPNNGRIEVQTHNLDKGLYFVSLLTENGEKFTSKWIKK